MESAKLFLFFSLLFFSVVAGSRLARYIGGAVVAVDSVVCLSVLSKVE